MSKVRVGIIGTGGISHCHMLGYNALPDEVEVVAVCDIDEAKVKAYAEQYGVAAWYTDYNEMLEKEDLDCVSVTTWNSAHMPATVASLNAGVNVICEKPMAMNASEAEEMLAAAKESGRPAKMTATSEVLASATASSIMAGSISSTSVRKPCTYSTWATERTASSAEVTS